MTYSLVNVYQDHGDGTVEGSWLQDHVGTLEAAREKADRTQEVNSNRIKVAVVAAVTSVTPLLDGPFRATRLA